MTSIVSRVPGEALLADRGPHHRRRADAGVPRIGVLALQGDVLEHLRLLDEAGAAGVVVRAPDDLDGLDGLVLPGGESTTIGKLCAIYGFDELLRARLAEGFPVFGTCAGAVLLSRRALRHDGEPSDQPLLGGTDTVVRRNAFGRQVASFEADIDVEGLLEPMHAVFIRAPWFEEVGSDVEVLAKVATPLGDKVVMVRQGNVLASAFHPELAGDPRLHRLFVECVVPRRVS
jgi:pyridoxal 5'-phosphate synthase pdxT subunit